MAITYKASFTLCMRSDLEPETSNPPSSHPSSHPTAPYTSAGMLSKRCSTLSGLRISWAFPTNGARSLLAAAASCMSWWNSDTSASVILRLEEATRYFSWTIFSRAHFFTVPAGDKITCQSHAGHMQVTCRSHVLNSPLTASQYGHLATFLAFSLICFAMFLRARADRLGRRNASRNLSLTSPLRSTWLQAWAA